MSLADDQRKATQPGFMSGSNVNAFGSLHLSVQEFNEALLAHGSACEHRQAILCPCVRIETSQPDISCSHCRGVGYLYPVSMRQPLIVLDTQRNATMKWAQAGLMQDGTVMMTFPCGIIPGRGDLILPDNDVHVIQEHLFREGSRRVDDSMLRDERTRVIKEQRKRPLGSRNEKLIYPTDVCVEAAFYIDADDVLVPLTEGMHYKLGPSNTWLWLDDWGPPPGKATSVRYQAPAAYMVEGSSPRLRQESTESMPYAVTLKRLDRVSPDDLR